MRIEISVYRDVDLYLCVLDTFLSPQLRNAPCKQLAIQVVTYLSDMSVLFSAEDISRTAYFEVAHSDLEAAAEFGIIHYRGKSLRRVASQNFALRGRKVRVRYPVASAHAPS